MEVDRISSLPEEIRNHIVSFLPMEEAIRTSVLSTKWKKVCSSLSILKFEQSYFRWAKGRNLQQFIEIVYQTLFQHDESDINTFEIHFNVDDNERDAFIPHLNQWISFAANHNVRQLQIWRTGWKFFPICLVPCSSLEVLGLGGIELIPTDIEFPNLKSLTLLVVDIFDATAVHQLLCGSSLLEHMFLCVRVSSDGRSNNILHVTPPNLKFFALQGWRFHEINFVSKNIQQLFYQGEPPKFDSEILSIVREADFIVTTGLPSASNPAFIRALGLPSPASRVDHHWASKILLDLCNVTKLNLGSLYVEFLTRERDLLVRLPTSCCSLKHLTVDLYATKNQVEVITFLLKSYPNLETLILKIKPQHEEDYNFNTEDYYWKTHDLNTDGMLENLRKAEIEFLQGSELEFDLVRFLLGNADVLEKMNIILSRENQTNAASSSSIKEKIEMFARVSRFAAISVLETNPGQWSY